MAKRLTGDEARAHLTAAIGGIEARSSAEVVLAIRHRAGFYLHADLLAGALAATLTLAFLLFSPWAFGTVAIFFDPLVVGALVGWLCSRSPGLRRALTPARVRRAAAETQARAIFHDKEVGFTRRQTGVLVLLALLEREVVVLPDRAVVEHVDPAAWQAALDGLARVLTTGGDAKALGNALERLGDALAAGLPRTRDDVNELSDEVDVA